MQISVSQYLGRAVEQSYVTFPVTAEGLREALEYLNTKMVGRHYRRLSPWQFDAPDDSRLCYAAMVAGDVVGVTEILAKWES